MKRSFRKNEEIKSNQSKYPSSRLKPSIDILNHILTRKVKICFDSIKMAKAIVQTESRLKRSSRSQSSNRKSQVRRQNSLLITEDELQFTKEEIRNMRRQCEQSKIMRLGQEFRDALLKIQRFDRSTYNVEGQKCLKMPIVNELRRLQRMKNQFQQMRSKIYDNELTVTCISNYLKLVSQMNKEIEKMGLLKTKVSDLQKRLSDLTLQHRKEIGQYKKKVMFLDLGNSRKKSGSSSVIAPDDSFSERSSNLQKDNQEVKRARESEIIKYQQNQVKMQGRIDDLTKELSARKQKEQKMEDMINTVAQIRGENERLSKENEGLKCEISDMQQLKDLQLTPRALLYSSKSSLVDREKQKVKELDDFLRCYAAIRQKEEQNNPYQQQLNQLRTNYPDSPLLQLLQSQLLLKTNHQTILNSLKEVISLFTQNAWKRRSRILRREQGEVFNCINQIISMLLALSKQRDQMSNSIGQVESWRKKYKTLSEENTEIKLSLKQFQTEFSKKGGCPQRKREFQNDKMAASVDGQSQRQAEQGKTNSTINHLYGEIQKLKEQLLQAKIDSDNNGCEQRLSSYKILYQKIRYERDNLKLLLEQKNQEYEISKQNEEKYEQVKVKDQHIINQLNSKLIKMDLQQRSLLQQLSKNKQQIDKMSQQIIQSEQKYNAALISIENMQSKVQIQQKQVNELKSYLQQSIQQNHNLQNAIRQLQLYLQNRNRAMEQKDIEHTVRYDKLSKQLQQAKQDFDHQRQIFRQKLAQFHEYSLITSSNLQSSKKSMQQLRQQLERANSQLSLCIRNSETQKRQGRKHIQQLLEEGQKRVILHSEQKRLLLADVERARTQEYEINQRKIKQLRESITNLRTENERLIHIIDSNEAPFNQLVQQHMNLSQEISILQESNKELAAKVSALLMEKQSQQQVFFTLEHQKNKLVLHIHLLEQKIVEYQSKINETMNIVSLKDDQNRMLKLHINNLESTLQRIGIQNGILQVKIGQQQLKIEQLTSILSRLQSELSYKQNQYQQSSKALQDKHGQYRRYLQQKLQSYEHQLNGLREREVEWSNKVERQMKIISEISQQKEGLLLIIGQKDHQLNLQAQYRQRQIADSIQKCNQLQSVLQQRTAEIEHLRKTTVDKQIIGRLVQVVDQKQEEANVLRTDIANLKHTLQQTNKHLQGHQQSNKKTQLQNRRLVSKIGLIQSQFKQCQQKYRQYLQKSISLESHLQQINQDRLQQLKKPCLNTQQDSSSDQLMFIKQQISAKEGQVSQLRHLNFTLQKKYSDLQKKVAQLEVKEQLYQQQRKYNEEVKVMLKESQARLIKLQRQKKLLQDNQDKRLWQGQQQTIRLRLKIEQLIRQNKGLTASIDSSKASERQLLLQIVKDLDEDYKLGAEESYIKTLQKISKQITELLNINNALRQKCELSTQNQQIQIEQMENNLSLSLRLTIDDLLLFLTQRGNIKMEDMPFLSTDMDISNLIDQLGPFLKQLFATCLNSSELEISKYNNIIQDITILIEEAYSSNNVQGLSKLLILLRHAD